MSVYSILKVVIFSCVSFFTLFVLSKLLGKKQIAQLSFVDYVIGISIGSIAAEMSAETERPFYYYLIAMSLFFLLDVFVSIVGRKGCLLKRIFKGKPIVLIYEGRLNYKNLKKSKLDINDLLMLLRNKDYFDITQIAYALLENNGSISVMPLGAQRPCVVKDLSIPIEQATLPNYLVTDGVVSNSGLAEISKDKKWLFERLRIKNKKQLKQIILASYDPKNDKITTNKKAPQK